MINRVMIAMSGGVDSSVAAALLAQKECYDLEGAYIRTWQHEENFFGDCLASQEIEDARGVAENSVYRFESSIWSTIIGRRWLIFSVTGYQKAVSPQTLMSSATWKSSLVRFWILR